MSKLQFIEKRGDAILVKHLYTDEEKKTKPGFDPLAGHVRMLRASGVGHVCDKTLFMSVMGVKSSFNARTMRIFHVGNVLEPEIVSFMREDGWTVKYNGDTTLGIVIPVGRGIVTGHPDVFGKHDEYTKGKWGLIDVKTMNEKSYTEWDKKKTKESKPEYYVQVNLYGDAYQLAFSGIAGFCKNDSNLSYDVFPTDRGKVMETKARVEHIFGMDVFSSSERDPQWKCRFCSMSDTCCSMSVGGMKTTVPGLVDPDRTIDLLAHRFELVDREGNRIEPRHPMEDVVSEKSPDAPESDIRETEDLFPL